MSTTSGVLLIRQGILSSDQNNVVTLNTEIYKPSSMF